MKRYRVLFSRTASRDLQRLAAFLRSRDAADARLVEPTLRAAVEALKRLPFLGRVAANQTDPTLRELLIPFGATGYVLLYRVRTGEIRVLAVRHQLEGQYQ
ncbi:MAG: type II toxin-antitoxin system RelE/ParE family toxin [Archangium sp.]